MNNILGASDWQAFNNIGDNIRLIETPLDSLFKSDKISFSPITSINAGNENIVDSFNLKSKVKKCIKLLQIDEIKHIEKIKICNFICKSLSDMYKISKKHEAIISYQLSHSILYVLDCLLCIKLGFLNFKNVNIVLDVSKNLFENNIKDTISRVGYMQILKFLLRNSNEQSLKDQVILELESMYIDPEVNLFHKMEIADIFILNGMIDRGHEMIGEIRLIERRREIVDFVENTDNHAKTLYDDSQNTHNTNINTSVLRSAVQLMTLYRPESIDIERIKTKLTESFPEHSDCINIVTERVIIDQSKFNYDSNMFGIRDVFSSLISFIDSHKYKKELQKRLVEEMVAMSKYCTTGHLSRFINVFQGFTDDEKLQIRISDYQQIKSVIFNCLNVELQNAPEEVMDSSIESNKSLFYTFIVKIINNNIQKYLEEYGEVLDHVLEAVKEYSREENWDIIYQKIVLVT